MTWRERFGMHTAPLPAAPRARASSSATRTISGLARAFCWLATEPGLGVLTGEPGVGKSAAIRHLCRALHPDEHRVLYLSDCAVKPLDLYRMLAAELGLRPSARADRRRHQTRACHPRRRARDRPRRRPRRSSRTPRRAPPRAPRPL
ncbi:MAG: ATP-binding protein [Myxococcales bacterium]|nr:ATP-binding protein [Myxococcales bacterium]